MMKSPTWFFFSFSFAASLFWITGPCSDRQAFSGICPRPLLSHCFVSLLMYRHVRVCFRTRREKRWISAHKKEIIAPEAASFPSCLKWFLQSGACLSRNYCRGVFLSLGCFHVAAFVFVYLLLWIDLCRVLPIKIKEPKPFAVIKK